MHYMFTTVLSSSWIDPLIIIQCPSLSLVKVFILKSIWPDTSIATPDFLWIPFAWNTFFHPITFSLHVSLDLKWVCCVQHIHRSWFCIHSANICLLYEAFNLFVFQGNYRCVCSYSHFVNCSGFAFACLFPSLPLLFPSLVIWWLFLVLYLYSFSLYLIIYCRFSVCNHHQVLT